MYNISMPNYQYRCVDCHLEINEIRLINEETKLTSCTQCDGKLKRIYVPPAISFKGSGFYKNNKK